MPFDWLGNWLFGNYQQEQQYHYNSQLAQQQYQLNKHMYEAQLQDQKELFDQYQSPEAQVRLYKEAGLNPALMMGKGTSTPSMTTPTMNPVQIQGQQLPLPQFEGLVQEVEQIANFVTNVKKNKTELKKMQAEVVNLETANKKMIAEIGQITKNTEKLDADIQKIWSDISLTDEQKKQVIAQVKQIESLTDKTDNEVLNIISQRELLEYEKRLKAQQQLLLQYQALNEKYKGRKTLQEIVQIANENALYSLRKENLTLQNIGLEEDIALKLLQGDISLEQLRGIMLDNQMKELEQKYKSQENARQWVKTGVDVFGAVTGYVTKMVDALVPL